MSDVITGQAAAGAEGRAPRLTDVNDFGVNPGRLRMCMYRPAQSSRRCPLVVVLHGCRQTAEGYNLASGWSRLAEAHDFMLLFPEQKSGNNHDRCFSWFEPAATRRGQGEVESIREMILASIEQFGADPRRIFICGLSAGGAMTAAMLATYPELFKGGAILAGLPFGTASNVSDALQSMSSGRIRDAKAWGDDVRAASAHKGAWPAVAIWHGTHDTVVRPINSGELVKQWTNVHHVGASIPDLDEAGGATRRAWTDASGRDCVIEYSIAGLGHGAAVDDADPPAPFFLPAGISSTKRIAQDWGLTRRAKPRQRDLRTLFGF